MVDKLFIFGVKIDLNDKFNFYKLNLTNEKIPTKSLHKNPRNRFGFRIDLQKRFVIYNFGQ